MIQNIQAKAKYLLLSVFLTVAIRTWIALFLSNKDILHLNLHTR